MESGDWMPAVGGWNSVFVTVRGGGLGLPRDQPLPNPCALTVIIYMELITAQWLTAKARERPENDNPVLASNPRSKPRNKL